MANLLEIDANLNDIERLLAVHHGTDYAQCLKCGSIKSDSKEILETILLIIGKSESLSEDDVLEEIKAEMISFSRDLCADDREFSDWFCKHQDLYLPQLNDYDDFVFLKARDIVLRSTQSCNCFKQNT